MDLTGIALWKGNRSISHTNRKILYGDKLDGLYDFQLKLHKEKQAGISPHTNDWKIMVMCTIGGVLISTGIAHWVIGMFNGVCVEVLRYLVEINCTLTGSGVPHRLPTSICCI